MQQPSLRAVLMAYLALSSRSLGVTPGVTMPRLMQPGSTAASRSTCTTMQSQGGDACPQGTCDRVTIRCEGVQVHRCFPWLPGQLHNPLR